MEANVLSLNTSNRQEPGTEPRLWNPLWTSLLGSDLFPVSWTTYHWSVPIGYRPDHVGVTNIRGHDPRPSYSLVMASKVLTHFKSRKSATVAKSFKMNISMAMWPLSITKHGGWDMWLKRTPKKGLYQLVSWHQGDLLHPSNIQKEKIFWLFRTATFWVQSALLPRLEEPT